MNAILIKELRENLRWLLIGILLFSVAGWFSLPTQSSLFSPVHSNLAMYYGMLGVIYASALGAIQSAFDLRNGSRAYLHCRGVTARDIALAKIASGFSIYAASICIPLTIIAIYLGAVGLTYYPVRPLQVIPGLLTGLAAFSCFPAVMMTLARPASWWGTRLFPMGMALGTCGFCSMSLSTFSPTIGVLVFLGSVFSIGLLSWSAINAWSFMASNPSGGPLHAADWPSFLVLFASVSCAILFLLIFVGTLTINMQFSSTPKRWWAENQLSIDSKTGEPWIENRHKEMIGDDDSENLLSKTQRSKLTTDSVPEYSESTFPSDQFNSFHYVVEMKRARKSWNGFFSAFPYSSDRCTFHRGYFLYYSQPDGVNRPPRNASERFRLRAIIAADGVYPPGRLNGKPFETLSDNLNPLHNSIIASVFAVADSQGVYQLNLDKDSPSITNVVQIPVDRIVVDQGHEHEQKLTIVSNGELFDYWVVDEKGKKIRSTNKLGTKTRIVHAELNRKVKLPAKLVENYEEAFNIASHSGGYAFHDFNASLQSTARIINVAHDGTVSDASYVLEKPLKDTELQPMILVASIAPVFFYIVAIALAMLTESENPAVGFNRLTFHIRMGIEANPMTTVIWICLSVAAIVVSMIVVARLLRTRDVSGWQRPAWLLSCIPFGLVTPFVMIATYPRWISSRCPRCSALRRIDELRCHACKAPWDPPENEGIEIIDSQPIEDVSVEAAPR